MGGEADPGREVSAIPKHVRVADSRDNGRRNHRSHPADGAETLAGLVAREDGVQLPIHLIQPPIEHLDLFDALLAILVESHEVRPRALLVGNLGACLSDLANLRSTGPQHLGERVPCRLESRQDVPEGLDGEVFRLRAIHRRELYQQRLASRGLRRDGALARRLSLWAAFLNAAPWSAATALAGVNDDQECLAALRVLWSRLAVARPHASLWH